MAWFVCKCGLRFSTRPELGNHIGIGNDRWPREAVDEHGEAEKWENIKDEPRRIEPITGKEGFRKDKL